MNKISGMQAATVLRQAGQAVRKQAAENRILREKVAAYESRERCEKIAHALEEKNMHGELTFEEKVAHLAELPPSEMAAYEKAVDLVAGGGVKLASVVDHTPSDRRTSRLGEFLLTRDVDE